MVLDTTTCSKYTFTEPRAGECLISAPDREPVSVVLDDRRVFCVCAASGDHGRGVWRPMFWTAYGGERPHEEHCYGYALCDWYGLLDGVAHKLMARWTPRCHHPRQGRRAAAQIHMWAIEKTKWSIGSRLYDYYVRATEHAHEKVLAVQRNVFAATFTFPLALSWAELYQDPWLVKDLGRYRAAAVALANLKFFWDSTVKARARQLREAPETQALMARAHELGVEIQLNPRSVLTHPPSTDELLALLQDWRGLYSPDGQSYRSLNRTLDHLPGGVSYKLVPYLSWTRLETPITHRVVLSALTLYLQRHKGRGRRADHERVFAYATADRIKRAAVLVSGYMRQNLNTRRTADLARLIDFLADFPEPHHGNIVGLAEKSIDWHRNRQEREAQRIVDEFGGQRETALPPIPLPEQAGIRFLSTVDELLEEAASMENCLASHARKAVSGQGFYFHVQKGGEAATVEVSRMGKVIQAAGPRNRYTDAAGYGARVLRQWARDWPEELPPPRPLPPVHRAADRDLDLLGDFDDIPF